MKGVRVAVWVPLLMLASVVTRNAGAAEEIGLGIAYDPRAPVGSFRSVVPDGGFGGFQAKWDYFPVDELSIGFGVQYNNFRRAPPESMAGGSGFAAPTYRNVSFWSFLPTVRYYLSTSALRPYAELGAGFSNATGAVRVHDFTQRDVVPALIVQPSMGVLMRLSDDDSSMPSGSDDDASGDVGPSRRRPRESLFGMTVSVSYAFTTADVGGARNVGYAGFQLGIYAKP